MKFGEIEITQSITPDERTVTFTLSDASLTQNQTELILKMNDALDGLDEIISVKQFNDHETKSLEVTLARVLFISELVQINQFAASILRVMKILNIKK